jgi:ATP/ADP translocase
VALILFLLVSMSTFIFNQYSFQELLKTQYVGRERALTDFLGYFNGTLLGISLIMQTFVNDKILTNYGLRTSLLVLPVVIGIFSIGSFASATVATFLGEQTETFVYFFLFVALMRLSSVSLRDSLENPIFKLFFIPLDNRYRFSIQARVEGQVNEFSRLIAGAAIYGFSLLPIFSVNYIPLFVFIFCVLYFFVVRNL